MTAQTDQAGSGVVAARGALVVGFLALAVALAAAVRTPAGSYERSIYAATPGLFWLGVGLATLVALVVALWTRRGSERALALLLGGQATVAIAGLPVIRQYRYHGIADAMTHLGWAREVSSGEISPLELFYPGLHALSAVIAQAAGVSVERAVLIAVLALVLVALAFVPLAVRAVDGREGAVVVGTFAAFLLLPINLLSTHPFAHSFTQAMLFSAFAVYLLARYVRLSPDSGSATRFGPTATGTVLALVGVVTVLFHPQLAANLLVLLGAVSLVQFVHRRLRPAHPIASHRTLYGQTALLAAAFVGWSFRFALPYDAISGIAFSLFGYVIGEPPTPAESVGTQGASLAAIGATVEELFLKLFLVSGVFVALAAGVVLWTLLGFGDDEAPESNALIAYLGVGVLALVPVFGVYFAGGIGGQYFRHLGFVMLLVTILGAVALVRLSAAVEGWLGGGPLGRGIPRTVLLAAFVVMLPLAALTAFQSPHVYQPTQHVTDHHLNGHEAAFELADDEEAELLGVRAAPWREYDAVHGVERPRAYWGSVDDGQLDSVGEGSDEPQFLVVSQYDRESEVGVWRELRYSEDGFDSLETRPGVDRVYANEEVELYYAA